MPYFRTSVPHGERIKDHQDDFAYQQFDQGGNPSPRTSLVRRSSDSRGLPCAGMDYSRCLRHSLQPALQTPTVARQG